jgi:hypothetical protein
LLIHVLTSRNIQKYLKRSILYKDLSILFIINLPRLLQKLMTIETETFQSKKTFVIYGIRTGSSHIYRIHRVTDIIKVKSGQGSRDVKSGRKEKSGFYQKYYQSSKGGVKKWNVPTAARKTLPIPNSVSNAEDR